MLADQLSYPRDNSTISLWLEGGFFVYARSMYFLLISEHTISEQQWKEPWPNVKIWARSRARWFAKIRSFKPHDKRKTKDILPFDPVLIKCQDHDLMKGAVENW